MGWKSILVLWLILCRGWNCYSSSATMLANSHRSEQAREMVSRCWPVLVACDQSGVISRLARAIQT